MLAPEEFAGAPSCKPLLPLLTASPTGLAALTSNMRALSLLRAWAGMMVEPPGCSGSQLHMAWAAVGVGRHCIASRASCQQPISVMPKPTTTAGRCPRSPANVEDHAVQHQPAPAAAVQLLDLIQAVVAQPRLCCTQALLAVLLWER